MSTAVPKLLTQRELAEQLRVSERTLERLRCEGHGPPYVKVGRRVLYSVDDLQTWLTDHRFVSTAGAKASLT